MKGCRSWLAGEPMAELCREFGISRKTGYKICDRYQDCGVEGLFRLLQMVRMTGSASAFAHSTDTWPPFRTLFTNAGRKQAMQIPSLCLTLG
jgi:Helix-turn-helix domain